MVINEENPQSDNSDNEDIAVNDDEPMEVDDDEVDKKNVRQSTFILLSGWMSV